MEHLNCTESPSQKGTGEEIEIHDIGKNNLVSSPPSIAEEVEESYISKNNISDMEEGNLYAAVDHKSKIPKTQYKLQKSSGYKNIIMWSLCFWRILCLILAVVIVFLLIMTRQRVLIPHHDYV